MSTQPQPGSETAPEKHSILRNWISLAGAIVASGGLFSFLLLTALDLMGKSANNPYLGILTYVVAPFFIVLGLTLVVWGVWLRRRQQTIAPNAPAPRLAIDLSRKTDRRLLVVFGLGTLSFLLLSAVGSYQTYVYTESDQFCGAVCHSVMGPEFTAYQRSSHARVACVECHVGSGAAWYVKAKINGTRQLYDIVFNKVDRPIPVPVRNLRPARDTCEQCHWPQKFTGSIERTFTHFMADDKNTAFTVRLLVNVGGANPDHGKSGGIHWHMNSSNKVEYYATDAQRQVIPWVRLTAQDGTATVYRTPDFKGEPDPAKIRQMDCIDCHNRPAHRYATPNDAMDEAMDLGRVDAKLPAIKRTAVDLLTKPYSTQTEAVKSIDGALRTHYAGRANLDASVAAVEAVYRANFFPEMKADWSKYPDNIGHMDSVGCFRCHDGKHSVTGSGKVMAATDCNSCHTILAQGSGADLAKLSPVGLPFNHPSTSIDGLGLLCSDCHNGKNQDN